MTYFDATVPETDTNTTDNKKMREAMKMDATKRCDRCGAHAYVTVTLDNGMILEFCGHHGKQMEAHFRIDQFDYTGLKELERNEKHQPVPA